MMSTYSKSLLYPRWCFCINEDVTRENKADYDRRTARLYDRIADEYPDWLSLSREDRREIRERLKAEIGGRW